MRTVTALWIAAASLLAGCAGNTAPTTEIPPPFGSWLLQAFDLDFGQSVPISNPDRYTLALGSDSRVDLLADCNLCSGSYTTSGTRIELGILACTRAACPPDSLESSYLAALGSVSSYELASGELFLRYAGGVLRLVIR